MKLPRRRPRTLRRSLASLAATGALAVGAAVGQGAVIPAAAAGTIGFAQLQAAFAAGCGGSAEQPVVVSLDQDVSQASSLTVRCDARIDLAGHDLALSSIAIAPGESLDVTDTTSSPGLLTTRPDFGDPGIRTTGAVFTTHGRARVTALAQMTVAAIGGGMGEPGGTVEFHDDSVVVATAELYGAGIGGGQNGAGGVTLVEDRATVTATGGLLGSGIGGGRGGQGGTTTIRGGVVTAVGSQAAPVGPGTTSQSGYAPLRVEGGTLVLGGAPQTVPTSSTVASPLFHIGSGGALRSAQDGLFRLQGTGILMNQGALLVPTEELRGPKVAGNNYQVRFDLNGAPGTSPATVSVHADTFQLGERTFPGTTPIYSDHEFLGWNTERAGTGTALDAAALLPGESTTGDPVVVTAYAQWKPPAPTVSSISPAAGSTAGANEVVITGTGLSGATAVTFGGTPATAYTIHSSSQITARAPSGTGTVDVRVTTAGGTSATSANTRYTYVDPPAAPVVTAPANGSVLDTGTPVVRGTAPAHSTVTVYVDGSSVGTTPAGAGGDWSHTVPAQLAQGSHTVRAVATAGGVVSASSNTNTFTVDTTPPASPVVAAPANGATTTTKRPTYSGTAEADSTVTVLVDGSNIGTTTANATGHWTHTQPTDLSEGSHTVRATATDNAGNTSPSSGTNAFTVDSVPPVAPTIALAPASDTGMSSTDRVTSSVLPVLRGATEAGASVLVYVDDATTGIPATVIAGSWSVALASPLEDGAHTFYAVATDAAGNAGPPSSTITVTIDTTAPAAPVLTAPANAAATSDSTPTATGTAESGSTVTVSVDSSVVGSTTANGSGDWALTLPTALAEGTHTVRAAATDAAGNTSADSTTSTFTIDTTPPAAPVVSTPADGSTTNDDTPTYSGTAEADSTVAVIVDGSSIGTTTADASGSWTHPQPTDLSEGSHTVRATATDNAGSTSPSSTTNTFTVDTDSPDAPIVTGPANGATATTKQPTYSGTAEADSTVTVILDGSSIGTTTADASGNWTHPQPTDLSEGSHTVRATATDRAGNTSTSSSTNTFTVDTASPEAPVISSPTAGARTTDRRPTVAGTTEPGSQVAVSIDGSPAGTATVLAGSWSFTVPSTLALGDHTVTVVATDSAGNSSGPASVTFRVVRPADRTPPAAPVVTTPADGAEIPDPSPEISGTAELFSTVTVTVDGTVLCTATAAFDGNWRCQVTTRLAEGLHVVSATARDAAGNTSPATTATFTVMDTTAPGAPSVEGSADGVRFSGIAEAGSTVEVTSGGTRVCSATASDDGAWSCTPGRALAPGVHLLSVTATDEAGNRSTPTRLTVTVPDPKETDSDGDGLSDHRELRLGTDPENPDTDGDGVRDGVEVDGYRIKQQVVAGPQGQRRPIGLVRTDPTRADTDRDGLTDREERAGARTAAGVLRRTDPTRADTDRDGVSDAREVRRGSDPTRYRSRPGR